MVSYIVEKLGIACLVALVFAAGGGAMVKLQELAKKNVAETATFKYEVSLPFYKESLFGGKYDKKVYKVTASFTGTEAGFIRAANDAAYILENTSHKDATVVNDIIIAHGHAGFDNINVATIE